jgi:RHS repeat-associated protein
VPGTPAQAYYYGIDQIGSVRRVFASTSSAPAYGYDPYGTPLQATAPLTDFVYGGMFYNADSGLYLTKYRAYDPVTGRWLSRDPMGEISDVAANLYPYVGGNPVGATDPDGRMPWMHRPMRRWPSLPDLPSIPLPDGAMMACAFYGMCGPPPPPAPSTSGTCPKAALTPSAVSTGHVMHD